MSRRRRVGALGERLASDFLQRHGYQIRETNFRCPQGELDIVAEQADCLVFVEVRTRTSQALGRPEESITEAKKQRLVALANAYMQSHGLFPSRWRIDLVAVELTPQRRLSRVELIENITE